MALSAEQYDDLKNRKKTSAWNLPAAGLNAAADAVNWRIGRLPGGTDDISVDRLGQT
jgi:hypothetical protein